jgi:hypothetical protein
MPTKTISDSDLATPERCDECGHPVGSGTAEGLPHRDHEAYCSRGICGGCGSTTTHYAGCPHLKAA